MELLDEIEWKSLLNESDVDLYWSALKNYFLQVANGSWDLNPGPSSQTLLPIELLSPDGSGV